MRASSAEMLPASLRKNVIAPITARVSTDTTSVARMATATSLPRVRWMRISARRGANRWTS